MNFEKADNSVQSRDKIVVNRSLKIFRRMFIDLI